MDKRISKLFVTIVGVILSGFVAFTVQARQKRRNRPAARLRLQQDADAMARTLQLGPQGHQVATVTKPRSGSGGTQDQPQRAVGR